MIGRMLLWSGAAVVGVVALAAWGIHITMQPTPLPPAVAGVPRGYVVLRDTVPDLGALPDHAAVCATHETADLLAGDPALARFDLRPLPAAEISPGWEGGTCDGVLVRRTEHLTILLPHGHPGARAVMFDD